MRERSENLRPHNAKIADAPIWNLGEDAVEDVAEQMHTQTQHDGFAAFVAKYMRKPIVSVGKRLKADRWIKDDCEEEMIVRKR